MIYIENDILKAGISLKGAELISLVSKDKKLEVMWDARPEFWARRAPVLFPNVGKYYGGSFLHNGITYSQGQHGFARDAEFSCIKQDKDYACFRFESSEDTLKQYPFPFILDISFSLHNNKLAIDWTVHNPGDETMYFTIGGHPAFNVPAIPGTKFVDYSLYFEDKDQLEYKLLDMDCGCIIADSSATLPLDKGKFRLRNDMFDNDALVFDDNQFDRVSLLYPNGSPYVTLEAVGFPNFGIWSKPGAPFVCLEPWVGRADNVGFEDELKNKPGINAVAPGESFSRTHSIIIG